MLFDPSLTCCSTHRRNSAAALRRTYASPGRSWCGWCTRGQRAEPCARPWSSCSVQPGNLYPSRSPEPCPVESETVYRQETLGHTASLDWSITSALSICKKNVLPLIDSSDMQKNYFVHTCNVFGLLPILLILLWSEDRKWWGEEVETRFKKCCKLDSKSNSSKKAPELNVLNTNPQLWHTKKKKKKLFCA